MITSLDQPINKTDVLGDETVFTVEPPQTSPFTAQASVSFKPMKDAVEAEPVKDSPAAPQEPGTTELFQRIVGSSERELKKRPQSSTAHSNLGIALLNSGKLEEAIQKLNESLALNDRNYAALAALAKAYILRGDFTEARALYDRARALAPRRPGPLLGLANLANREGRLEEGCALLRDVIRLNEKVATPHYHLGITLLRMNRIQAAINELRKATHLDVRIAPFHHALGVAYALAQSNRKAIRSLQAALSLAPDLSESVHALANVLLEEGQAEAVVTLLRKHLETAPHDTTARETLARAYSTLGKHAASRAQLFEVFSALEKMPEDKSAEKARVHNNIGVNYMNEQNYMEAEKHFRKATALAPSEQFPWHNLAKVCVLTGRVPEALKLLRKANYRLGTDETSLLIASILGNEGEYQAGLRELLPVLASGHAGPQTYACAGFLASDGEQDFQSAKLILTEGLQRYPGNKPIVNNLAYVLLMLGETTGARAVLESLSKKDKASVEMTATWGLLHLREGDIATGTKLYQEAQQIALSLGKSELAKRAYQKLHLELATHYLESGKPDDALREIKLGLLRRPSKEGWYTRDLEKMQQRLQSRA